MSDSDISPQLHSAMSIPEYKQIIQDADNYLNDNFTHVAIDELVKMRSQFFDSLLLHLWQHTDLDNSISLNAIGGYGRQTLHPHSDIDLCLIFDKPLSNHDAAQIGHFFTQLWDIGLELGHSVRGLDEISAACAEDITIATSLLEIRHLAGPSAHAEQVLDTLYEDKIWSGEGFFRAKVDEQTQRHMKARGSAFSLEPNLKNSPGGMRDIQTLIWVARKYFAAADMAALRRFGFFTADEYAELLESQHFIWRTRWALHTAAQRAENRLLIALQSDVARLMGFGDNSNLAIEKMMRQLYRAMRRISELNQMLLQYFDHEILSQPEKPCQILNEHFEIKGRLIYARHDDVFVDRNQLIALFCHIAEHASEIDAIAPQTLRLIRQVRRRLLGDLQDFQQCRKGFVALFKHPEGMGLALSLMHKHGILASYLPQWREIVGQMQFDLYHAYPVDEHTHKLLKNLYALNSKSDDETLTLPSAIFSALENKETLLFAALFHDLAKGRGGDHSELGAVDALQFAKFHDLKPSQAKVIAWLVENHLLLSLSSQRLDIYDPSEVKNLAKTIGTKARLDALYCLTVADIKATNDDLWTNWKATLLRDLYMSIRHALRNGLENVLEQRAIVREHKNEALELLGNSNDTTAQDAIKQLWKRLPLSFFSSAKPQEIAHYSQALIEHGTQDELILIDESYTKGSSDLFVYMKDKPGLFVTLFNTLASLQISVQQANISKTKDGYVVESLKILDYDHQPISTASRRGRIKQKLRQVLFENKCIPKQRKNNQIGSFICEPKVEFLHSRKKDRTLISVTALDNPKFMSHFCQGFRQFDLNIHSARITTVGEQVDNVFLVSDRDGQPLDDESKQALKSFFVDTIKEQHPIA
ncbi:[protein-PII] uridylyltransferase [Shewanella colwelliana]|uniref:Bifunctional uridylyltransferase/uridylyl-removing enzyme n=1 Tax=Shewanella colwelliana TaxID=23 RepID=A0A1E5IN83_SHECO|nr:[protein-PII] uridylyltransferase [Shewanella colwelliana]MDX1282720.1 [protein-PII] uridylyltransferase [Shewanella colwelliana]OEG71991.1 [protein-PII] uridylyltransferase [Shewanella colwelliana]GIU40127.1 bifunctional uridylyltransferase/uridylyl-removing enzyme [Shewanella colwelliana]